MRQRTRRLVDWMVGDGAGLVALAVWGPVLFLGERFISENLFVVFGVSALVFVGVHLLLRFCRSRANRPSVVVGFALALALAALSSTRVVIV